MSKIHQVTAILLKIEIEKTRSGSIALFSRAKAQKKKAESKDSAL
jgi:hypothetical protein